MSSMIETKSASVISEINMNRLCRDMKDVSLEGPTRIGYYSSYKNDEKESVFLPDKSSLAYLDLPNPVYINCLQGYDKKAKYGHILRGEMLMLRWVLNNKATMQKFPSDFICYNGLLRDLMNVKYTDADWNISATKIEGKIILNRKATIEAKERVETQCKRANQSSYVADNLPRLITKNINHSQCSSRRLKDSFHGVFHTKVGSHRILHAGYLDCVESEQELTKPFDEMKLVSIKKFNASRQSHSTFQAYNWWSLAKLAAVDTIVRVKCDWDFMVKKIDMLDGQSLIHKDRQIMFFATLNTVLDHFKSIVTEENKCYKFIFNAKNRKLTSYMMMDLDESLIPSWYIDQQIPIEC